MLDIIHMISNAKYLPNKIAEKYAQNTLSRQTYNTLNKLYMKNINKFESSILLCKIMASRLFEARDFCFVSSSF